MKIGFDGKRAANNLTGLGNYSRSLIFQLANYFPNNQYLVYAARVKEHPQIKTFFKTKGISLELAWGSFLWRSFGILKQLKSDEVSLYHGLSQELPVGIRASGIKSIVTIHDLIYIRFPQYFPFLDRLIYKWKGQYACKHADGILAISERSRQDLISLFNVPAAKIKVIYQSCDDSFKQPFRAERFSEIKVKYALPDQYILNVGTIEERKNQLSLVKAMKHVPASVKLVLIGKQQAYAKKIHDEIDQLNLRDRVIFLKDVSFLDLPGIYQMARLFVYPSIYEGFGIPIIEALYSGVPVIAATGSCLEEAGGPSSIYVHPEDVAALAAAINRLLLSEDQRQLMIDEGLKFVQKFNNEIIAQELMAFYSLISASRG
jgi:glycosyltransferase involved in cell wall biosynthesis